MSLIKTEIKETLSMSSIHSVPNIIQNRFKSIKIVWGICFLVSAASCAFFITTTLSEYLEYDVVSKSTIKFQSKIDFPIVSICDSVPFTTEYATEFISKRIKFNLTSDFNFSKSQNGLKYDYYTKRYISLIHARIQNETVRKQLGRKLDYILITCYFNAFECNLSQDFEYYYDFLYGNCFRYNSGRNMNGETTSPKQISNTGISNGFQIELFIGRVDQNNNLFSIDNGINLFIEHERIDSQSSEGIRISPGTRNYISLSKYSMSHLPMPYSDCTADLDKLESSDNVYFRNLISNNQSYTESLCRYNCFQKYLGDACQCQDLYSIPFYKDLPFCFTNEKKFLCQINSFVNFSRSDLFKDCDCPIRCENNFYTYKSSSAEYPTRFYAQFLSQNKYLTKKYNFSDEFSYEDYRNNLAFINIFYDELKETIVEHNEKISVVELISNIGGTLGFLKFYYSFFK